MAMTPDDFLRWYNAQDIEGRLAWHRMANHGTIPQALVDQVVEQFIVEHYGAMATYLDDPELGPLLRESAKGGWTPEMFNAKLTNTTWWQTHTAAQRQWDMDLANDPKEGASKIAAMEANIRSMVSAEGVSGQFTDTRITALATQFLRDGVAQDTLPRAILAEVQFNPAVPLGTLGARQSTLAARARNDWMIPLSDQGAFEWAKSIEMGNATADGADEYFRQIAMGQYQHLADRLSEGQTVRTLLDPYIQQTAGLLERGPNELDFLDPKLQPILDSTIDGDRRMMSLSEAGRYIRGTDEFAATQQGFQMGASLAEGLLQKMGKTSG